MKTCERINECQVFILAFAKRCLLVTRILGLDLMNSGYMYLENFSLFLDILDFQNHELLLFQVQEITYVK